MAQPIQKLGLGTVQWGMPYGVSNTHGQTPREDVTRILALARSHGVGVIDTANMYGNAEEVLGGHDLRGFRIVSKTPRLDDLTGPADTLDRIERALEASLQRLKVPSLHGYLVHQARDLLTPAGPWIAEALRKAKSDGRVANIGVSVYDRSQIDAVLQLFVPDIIQLPLSVFDQRLLADGTLDFLCTLDTEIHVRSVFLQGLLFFPPHKAPAYFEPLGPHLKRWHERLAEQRMSVLEGAIAFARDLPQIRTIVVGVESAGQFAEIVHAYRTAPSTDFSDLACQDPRFIDPTRWKLS